MKALAMVAVILLSGCGSARVSATASPPAGVTAAASASPASAPRLESPSPPELPTPSPIALLPVVDPGFSCRLPVDNVVGATLLTGGFVAVPGGVFQPDPGATLVSLGSDSFETAMQPALKGTSGLAFDTASSRWVPADPGVISDDGSQYAWTDRSIDTTNRLHITTVADGTDRSWPVPPPSEIVGQGPPRIPVPLAITTGGVLLSYGWEGDFGVWRLDLTTGLLTKLSSEAHPVGYGAAAVWLDPLRGNTQVGPDGGDTLARLDLTSGSVVDWFHRDGVSVGYLGIDRDGNPWMETWAWELHGVPQIWRVRGPGQADLILAGQSVNEIQANSRGTWFANDSGVYLFADGSLERVSAAPVGELLGPCI